MMMEHDEADQLKNWFFAYNKKVRMEYGQAMNLLGFEPDIIACYLILCHKLNYLCNCLEDFRLNDGLHYCPFLDR